MKQPEKGVAGYARHPFFGTFHELRKYYTI